MGQQKDDCWVDLMVAEWAVERVVCLVDVKVVSTVEK